MLYIKTTFASENSFAQSSPDHLSDFLPMEEKYGRAVRMLARFSSSKMLLLRHFFVASQPTMSHPYLVENSVELLIARAFSSARGPAELSDEEFGKDPSGGLRRAASGHHSLHFHQTHIPVG
jgi:hypothetical protein